MIIGTYTETRWQMSNNYQTEVYDKRLEEGQQFQDFAVDALYKEGIPVVGYSSKKYQCKIGENKTGIEIKHDHNFRKTGNLYIETEEKSNPDNPFYVKSGIYRVDNTWLYLIGDYKTFYLFPKKYLQIIHKEVIEGKRKYRIVENNTKTSRGMLLPVKAAEKYYSVKIIEIKD